MGYTEKFKEIFEKYSNDPKVFYEKLQELGQLERVLNLYRIEDKNTGEYVFFGDIINPEQIDYIKQQTGRDLILKPRQIGMTGLQIILNFDEAVFMPGTRAGIMAHTKDKAVTSIFDRVRKTYEWFLKDWGDYIPLQADTNSANQLAFNDRNSMVIVSWDFRSLKLNKLHVSETAFIKDDERVTASQQAVPFPPNGRVSHETTPRGRAGWFFDNWMASNRSIEEGSPYVWKQFFFKWWEHYPEKGQRFDLTKKPQWDEREKELMSVYNVGIQALLWRRWKIQESYQSDPERFEVDYPTDERDCFIGGYGLLPRSVLIKLEKKIRDPIFRGDLIEDQGIIKAVERKDGPVYIWEHPKPGVEYCGGIDSSEGLGRKHDYAGAILKNRSTKNQAACIHSNILPPNDMARYVYLLGTYYNKAWWCPERNPGGGGMELIRLLDQMDYGPIYMAKADKIIRTHDSQQLGYYTSGTSKEPLIMQFVSRLRSGLIIPSYQKWFDEMTNFGRDDHGRLCALAGHDDLFIAGCLCEEMDKTLGEMEIAEDQEYEKETIDPMTGFPV